MKSLSAFRFPESLQRLILKKSLGKGVRPGNGCVAVSVWQASSGWMSCGSMVKEDGMSGAVCHCL